LVKFKADKISPFNFFSLVFISKVLVAFTACTLVLTGEFSPDILTSMAISIAANIVVLGIVMYAGKAGKSPLNNKWLSLFYGVYFLFLASILVARFSFFASTELNPESDIMFYSVFFIAFCVYGAVLGIEPLARVSLLVFAIAVLGIITVVAFGFKEIELINLFPFTKNSTTEIIKNSLIFSGDASELVLFLAVSPKVNGKKIKPCIWATALAYIVCLGILAVIMGILGDMATMSAFPMFEVSQVSKFSDKERLDAVYTAFWIFAVFLKVTAFLYSGATAVNKFFKKVSHKNSCIACGGIMAAFCVLLVYVIAYTKLYIDLVIALYIILGFVIPVCCLIFLKKDRGELLIEKF